MAWNLHPIVIMAVLLALIPWGMVLDFGVNDQVTQQLPYWAEPGLGQHTAYAMWWKQESYESLPEDLQSTVDEVTERPKRTWLSTRLPARPTKVRTIRSTPACPASMSGWAEQLMSRQNKM